MALQYRFDSFGNFRGQDTFQLSTSGGLFYGFRNRLGHQGLFAERVNGHTEAIVFKSGAEVWYQSRSRWYIPELGRFMNSDPNATGVPTVGTLSKYGMLSGLGMDGSFDAALHYGDGWDTFTAYGENPVMYQDATGLFLGIAGLAVSQGIGAGMSAYDTLGDIEAGYGVQGQLLGEINSYMAQQSMLMSFMESMFDSSPGANRHGDRVLAAVGTGIVLVNGRRPYNYGLRGQRYPLDKLSPAMQKNTPIAYHLK